MRFIPHAKGERQWCARLTAADVVKIRALYADGMIMQHIAREFGVNSGTVWGIIRGKTWRHVS